MPLLALYTYPKAQVNRQGRKETCRVALLVKEFLCNKAGGIGIYIVILSKPKGCPYDYRTDN